MHFGLNVPNFPINVLPDGTSNTLGHLQIKGKDSIGPYTIRKIANKCKILHLLPLISYIGHDDIFQMSFRKKMHLYGCM